MTTTAESPTVTSMSFAAASSPEVPSGEPLVQFRALRRGQEIERAVRLPDGSKALSAVAAATRDSDLRDRFDGSWLRAPSMPASGGRGRVSIVDLFAGCGGLSLGLAEACRALQLEAEHSLAVELDETAAEVFGKNFSGVDVRAEPIQEIVNGGLGASLTARERRLRSQLSGLDMMLAGPPCQGHSDLNNHTRRDDPKNDLYLRAARFAEVVRPRRIVVENVPGVAHDRGDVVGEASDCLRRCGYEVSTAVLRASDYGAPQMRRRHVLLASLDAAIPFDVLDGLRCDPRSVMWAIDDLQDLESSEVFDSSARHSDTNRRRIAYLFENELHDLPNAQRPDCHRLKPHSYTAVYGRMWPDRPAPTITAGFGSTGQGRFVHPNRPRTLTPHEAARVQGFPDFFDFSPCRGRRALQQMIGNAVPSHLAYALGIALLRDVGE